MNVNKNQSGTPIVIGIDHGYGNIKTASSCFRTSVKAYDTEPTFTSNMLVYNGRYYIIYAERNQYSEYEYCPHNFKVL